MIYPNINAERSRHGLTLEAFANALGVNRKTIYNWMVRGDNRKTIYNWMVRGDIPQSALEKMADLFGCTIDYLLDNKHPTLH